MVSDNEITFVDQGSVAYKEGLKVGDRIKTVEGSKVSGFSDVERYVKANPGISLDFEIERKAKSNLRISCENYSIFRIKCYG